MKVFISYSHHDKDKALLIVQQLKENGFEVLGDFELQLGEDFRNTLNNSLLQADALVCLITPAYNRSSFANKELITAYTYNMARSTPRLLPIVFEGAEMPADLRDVLYLDARKETFKNVIVKLIASLNIIRNDKENRQKAAEEEREVFQTSLSRFIEKAMNRLQENERKNKRLAYLCYGSSGMFILIAILFSFHKVAIVFAMTEWQMAVTKTVSGTLTLALILALSRLLFVLGKSFMVEAIRNSDRIHAISFGEFFLNAYGNVATREEVRDVFGNWNIDNGSSFITQSPKDYDPQIIENLINAVNAFKDATSK